MVRLREIPRTAAFAWSPGSDLPLVVTGTRAGAVDADFSDETKLELWDLSLDNLEQGVELQPIASISTDSRYTSFNHYASWHTKLTRCLPQISRYCMGTSERRTPKRHNCWSSREWILRPMGCRETHKWGGGCVHVTDNQAYWRDQVTAVQPIETTNRGNSWRKGRAFHLRYQRYFEPF
jgi:hypothetical protein